MQVTLQCLQEVMFAVARSDSFMAPLGPIAVDQKVHLIWVTALTLVAIVPVFILLPIILWKYRRGSKQGDYRPKWEYSLKLEVLMWGVPIILVVVMSYLLWQATHKLDPYKELESSQSTINVQVVGLDWKWLFIYPDLGIATVGEFSIPVNHPVTLNLTTDTVMQSFIIPALAGQIYAMPGMMTNLNLLATEPGQMEGENTQYNGNGFVEQKFRTLALPPVEFEKWVSTVRQQGIPLNEMTYRVLARRSTRSEAQLALATAQMPADALYFKLDDPELFNRIMRRYLGSEGLEPHEQPGSTQYGVSAQPSSGGGN